MTDDNKLNVDELYATPSSSMTDEEPKTPNDAAPPRRETKIPFGVGLTLIICASLPVIVLILVGKQKVEAACVKP